MNKFIQNKFTRVKSFTQLTKMKFNSWSATYKYYEGSFKNIAVIQNCIICNSVKLKHFIGL